jgi:ABC-2 type transport system ATP-binding protein
MGILQSVPILEASGLTKVFRQPDKRPGLRGSLHHLVRPRWKSRVAVDGIDLSVEAGEAVAYVGPNGAGKSTTIKMLTGILVPTAGTVRVGGLVPHLDRISNARQIGVVFGQRSHLWWDLPVRDSLELLRDMHDLSQSSYERTLARLDDVLQVGDLMSTVARKLSLGQRMRADLAAALIHEPSIVYLDEPTIGLDISVKDRVRAFVRQLVAAGTTVMLTTHDLSDIEDICKRLVIIDEGRIAYDGDLQSVKDRYARDRVLHLTLANPPSSIAAVAARLPQADVRWWHDGEDGGPGSERELSITFDRFALSAGEVLGAVSSEADVLDVRIDEPAIEDVVRKLYAGTLESEHPGPRT